MFSAHKYYEIHLIHVVKLLNDNFTIAGKAPQENNTPQWLYYSQTMLIKYCNNVT